MWTEGGTGDEGKDEGEMEIGKGRRKGMNGRNRRGGRDIEG